MLDIFVLGTVAGMRTMTPFAVLCWAAYLGWLPQFGWSAWMGSLAAVIIFTLCALGEWIADLLPQTPSRRDLPLAVARMACGVAAGVLGWRGVHEPVAGGVVLGLLGALLGTYGGYRARIRAAQKIGRDWPVGICESLIAVALATAATYRLHGALVRPPVALLHLLHKAAMLSE